MVGSSGSIFHFLIFSLQLCFSSQDGTCMLNCTSLLLLTEMSEVQTTHISGRQMTEEQISS